MTDQEKKDFLTAFGNRVRKYRTEKQMSLDELARKCGYTSDNARSSIQKIESGKSDVPASKIRMIAKALEIPIGAIMGWNDEFDQLFDTEKLSAEVNIYEEIEKHFGKTTSEAVTTYIQLDLEDQAEIRGEMKQMMKSEKYAIQKESAEGKAI